MAAVSKMLEVMESIPKDKLLHSFYGVLVYIVVSAVTEPLVAAVAVVLLAVGKEVYDEVRYGGFSCGDVVATVAIPAALCAVDYYKGCTCLAQ